MFVDRMQTVSTRTIKECARVTLELPATLFLGVCPSNTVAVMRSVLRELAAMQAFVVRSALATGTVMEISFVSRTFASRLVAPTLAVQISSTA